ncbi:MAG: NAD(P)-dependent glycerol-3-phosphate dehydrogenase [bacterium]|nr:NAD(P)-dependent glycerol-3-phosphate dehydrogenase [bacterium]
MKVAVLGSGSFGTALASILATKDFDVTIWTRHDSLAESINAQHVNARYLPDLQLPANLKAGTDVEAILSGAEMVVLAIPAQQIGGVIKEYGRLMPGKAPIVSAAKGIEEGTLRIVSEIIEEELPESHDPGQLSYLSGPSFAKEMIQRIPTMVSIASHNQNTAQKVQNAFYTDYFRTYWTSDVIGVEVGGALKNVIAIAAGVADGLGFGLNTRAALITRGLTEITRMGKAKGADPLTFLGLAGMGDLVLTCTGDLSRNRTVGMKLGQGKSLKQALDEMNQVVEGVYTTESAYKLSQKLGVEMAITTEMYRLLYENKDAMQVTKELMSRELKREGI